MALPKLEFTAEFASEFAAEFKSRNEPTAPGSQPEIRSALEDIPHLAEKICAIWGTPELDVLLSQVVLDSRDGDRQGLPFEVAEEIMFMARTNKMLRAIDVMGKLGVNIDAAYKVVDEGDQARLRSESINDPFALQGDIPVEPSMIVRSGEAPLSSKYDHVRGLGDLMEAPTTLKSPIPKAEAALEAMPRLVEKICLVWGTQELDGMLSHLVMDSRDGDRQGLPLEVAAEILFIAQTNKIIRAMDVMDSLGINLDAAIKVVDEGDQACQQSNLHADDNAVVNVPNAAMASASYRDRPEPAPTVASQASGFGSLIFMLLRSKVFIFAVIAIILYRLFFR